MEYKDWILLLIPILANGIVIYFIQLYFQEKLKKREHKNEVKERINQEFFTLLLAVKRNFRVFNNCITDELGNTKRFKETLSCLNQSIRELLDFYVDYKVFLCTYASNLDQLDAVFNDYVKMGRSISSFSDEDKKQFEGYLNRILKLISDAITCYSNEI